LVAITFIILAQPTNALAGTCTGSLQAKIDVAPAGGTVTAEPCIYREQVTISKPITLKGQPGSEIRGSDVWTGWTYSGGYWRSSKTLPLFPQGPEVQCMPNTSRCLWPEQVFFDGKPLYQVASDPTNGQFAVDAERRVVLKDDPRNRFVEVTVRRYWVLGKTANVTIEGFTMKHAANEAQSGAIMNRMGRLGDAYDNWTVQNNRLSDAHGAMVSLKGDVRHYATGLKILNNDLYGGGELGIHGVVTQGEIIQGNEIHHNNTEDFNILWWEGGGLKILYAKGLVVDSNRVYSNKGNAVWCDTDCLNVTISNNRIHHNFRRGIHYEISESAKIFGNVVWENGWGIREDIKGAGIGVSNSRNVEVYANTLAWNADGLVVYAQDRESMAYDNVYGVYVHDNTVLAKDYASDPTSNYGLAWYQGPYSNQMFDSASNNRGAYNKYWYPDAESSLVRYEWKKTGYAKLANFNATPGEENGRYLTQSEKDAVVSNKGIPANPEPH